MTSGQDKTKKRAVDDAVITTLTAKLERDGFLTNEDIRAAASMLGIRPRSVRRKVTQRHGRATGAVPEPERQRAAWEPDEEFLAALQAMNGNAKGAMDAMADLGQPIPVSLRTVQRAVASRCDAAHVKAIRTGDVAKVTPILDRTHISRRLQSIAIDHTELPIWVLHKGRGVKPWLTTVEDEATRMLLAFTVTPHNPTTAESVATIARAVGGYDMDGVWVGGKPEVIHSDRGGDLVTYAMTLGLAELAVLRTTTDAYESKQNGRVERWHLELKSEYLPRRKGYYEHDTLTAEEKREHARIKTKGLCPLPAKELMTIDELCALLLMDMRRHNQDRPHTALGRRTPLEAWQADPTPISTVDPVSLRAAMTNRETRKVRKGRLEMRSRFYMSSDLDENNRGILSTYEDREVEIRYVPGAEDDTVWIYDPQTGQYLCDAFPVENRTQDDVAATKKSQAVLKRTFAACREDALKIRARLTEADLTAFRDWIDGYAPIEKSKSPSRQKTNVRRRTDKQRKKAKLLSQNTTPRQRSTMDEATLSTGVTSPDDSKESA